jgi:hypothetical protein
MRVPLRLFPLAAAGLLACTAPNAQLDGPDLADAYDGAVAPDEGAGRGADLSSSIDLGGDDLAGAAAEDLAGAAADMATAAADLASSADLAIVPGSKCTIGGTQYAGGTLRPGNPCQHCQPALSTSAWSDRPDGTGCGAGLICASGACAAGCLIAASYHAPDTVNPANTCESCQPDRATSAWSPLPDGTSCGGANECVGGACTGGCKIGGVSYPAGTKNPANPCEACRPGASTTAWSPDDGASCGPGKVCLGDQCESGCFIDGFFHPPGAAGLPLPIGLPPEVSASCVTCEPLVSTSAWTPLADGTLCTTDAFPLPFPGAQPDGVCKMKRCEPRCFVNTTAYPVGAVHPTEKCQECVGGQAPFFFTGWGDRLDGTACGPGKTCQAGDCK